MMVPTYQKGTPLPARGEEGCIAVRLASGCGACLPAAPPRHYREHGRLFMIRYLVFMACIFCLVPANAHAKTINMSHDLVRLGIASQNLEPNSPTVDAGPAFQATLEYVKRNGPVNLVTLDTGAYYFLTPRNPNAYLSLAELSNLTIDLAGSTMHLADAFSSGFFLTNCQKVTLTNFKIDFLKPPYTYVQLESVDSHSRTFTYGTLPGWPDPATLTAPIPVVLWAVAFRDGEIVPATSRMHVASPIRNNVLSLVQDNTPWTQSATLATLQSGDIIAVTQRGDASSVTISGGDSIKISHATVYGSCAMGVLFEKVSNSTADHVQVIPRKGNLFSTNADGVHFVDTWNNNHIRNCHIVRTLDDALAMDSLCIATVTESWTEKATVNRKAYSRFPNGTRVNFFDPVSDKELKGATIVFQDPIDSIDPVFGGQVMLSFDQPLPALTAGSGMIYASANQRGAGSSIERNRVEDILFGRGIWIGGSVGITIKNNLIGHTSNGGIVVFQGIFSYPLPPARDIRIEHNLVCGSLGPMASGSGTYIALGAIMVDSENNAFSFASSPVNRNISIQFNCVVSSGRTGIWVGQLNGGTIAHNSVIGYGFYPNLPTFGVNPAEEAQLPRDFTRPFVVHGSKKVRVFDNFSFPY